MVGIVYAGLYLIYFLFGIVIGSFLNVLIYRIPKNLNIAKGRSFCPKCETSLKALDLVPLFSYLFLGAKCRYCKEHISFRYPLVELLGGIFAMLSLYFWWVDPYGIIVFALVAILIVITFIDIDTQEIPDILNILLFVVAIISIFFTDDLTLIQRALGIIIVALPMYIIAFIIPGAFGGGDIKLCAAVGGFLGWKLMLLAGFIAIMVGGIFGIYLLISGKKELKQHFAFGPFLAMGIITSIYVGDNIINWYISLFGF